MPLEPINLGLRMTSGVTYDADAQAYFTAAGITDATQKAAVNTFILGLKTNSLWSSFYALYPFVGGTSGAHAVNAKSPGTYDITWVNSPTHNANGVTGNGTTNYGYTTGLSGTQVAYTCGVSVYNRTTKSSSTGVQKRLIGNATVAGLKLFHVGYTDNIGIEQNNGVLGAAATLAGDGNSTQRTGLLSVNRTGATTFKGYDDGVEYLTNSTSDTNAPHTVPFGILAANANGSYANHAPENLALAAVHTAHDATQAANFGTLVTAFQTALSRNV